MGLLHDKLLRQQQVITAEIAPPKGAGTKRLKEKINLLKPFVTAINITDGQRALVRMASWAACKVVQELGVEPVLQMTCRDRNTIALQADLMGASAMGFPNLLCLTGDPVKVGDSPESKPVFEIESVGLLKMVSTLQTGTDHHHLKMNAPTRFFMGAVVNPTLHGSNSQLERMKAKVAAGAHFFQTQANYDLTDFSRFLNAARPLNTPVLAGILVLHSADVAIFLQKEIPGIHLPREIVDRLTRSNDPEQEGLQIALESMLALEGLCQGFHLMTLKKEHLIPQLIKNYYANTTLENASL